MSKPQVPDMPSDQQQTAQLDSETHTPVNHGTGSAVQSAGAIATDTIPSTDGKISIRLVLMDELLFYSAFTDLWLVINHQLFK